MFGKRGSEVGDGFSQLAGLDLRNSESFLRTCTLEMRDGLSGIPLREQGITQKLVCRQQVGTKFQSLLQRSLIAAP